MDILDKIVNHKREEVAVARRRVPQQTLAAAATERTDRRGFVAALSDSVAERVRIIAEVKRASPSKGVIRSDLDPALLAARYAAGGAAALSVLTDKYFFSGSTQDLRRARAASKLPVLRKDFIVSAYQLYETAAMGADAALLIVRILSALQLSEYLSLCGQLGLDALVETHSAEEIHSATEAGATLIGINNRDLRTFKTSIDTTIELLQQLQPDQIAVAESGIHTPEDIRRLSAAGVTRFLVGESLVRSEDPAGLLRAMRQC